MERLSRAAENTRSNLEITSAKPGVPTKTPRRRRQPDVVSPMPLRKPVYIPQEVPFRPTRVPSLPTPARR